MSRMRNLHPSNLVRIMVSETENGKPAGESLRTERDEIEDGVASRHKPCFGPEAFCYAVLPENREGASPM